MTEAFDSHTRHRVFVLHDYTLALAHGDIDAVAAVLQEAEHDALLERMILELHSATVEETSLFSSDDVLPLRSSWHAAPPEHKAASSGGDAQPKEVPLAFTKQQEKERRKSPRRHEQEYAPLHAANDTHTASQGWFQHAEIGKRRYELLQSLVAVLIVGMLLGSFALLATHRSSPQGKSGVAALATGTSKHGPASGPGLQEPTVPPLISIRMVNQASGWALTKTSILKTSDGGLHWKDVTPAHTSLGQTHWAATADFMDARYAWIATATNQTDLTLILRTSDGGASWQQSTISDGHSIGPIGQPQFVSTTQGWVAIFLGGGSYHTSADIFQTHDGGQTWYKIASTMERQPNSGLTDVGDMIGLSFSDAKNGVVTTLFPGPGNQTSVESTSDGGSTWTKVLLAAPQGASAEGVLAAAPPVFFGKDGMMPVVVSLPPNGDQGLDLYLTHDGGQSWVPTTAMDLSGGIPSYVAPVELASDVYVLDRQHAWATNGTVFFSTSDGGQHWRKLATAPQPVGRLSFVNADSGWAIGASVNNQPLLLHTSNGGDTWQPIHYTINK